MCLMASAPVRVVGFGADCLAVEMALLKRDSQEKTLGKSCAETRVGGRAPFRVRTQWNGQMARKAVVVSIPTIDYIPHEEILTFDVC